MTRTRIPGASRPRRPSQVERPEASEAKFSQAAQARARLRVRYGRLGAGQPLAQGRSQPEAVQGDLCRDVMSASRRGGRPVRRLHSLCAGQIFFF